MTTPLGNPYAAFIDFTRRIDDNLQLRAEIKRCTNPEQIIAIALLLGFEFSREDLERVANAFYADFFPWAGRKKEWRANFFNRHLMVDVKSRHFPDHHHLAIKQGTSQNHSSHRPEGQT